jgi:hypothetical protein
MMRTLLPCLIALTLLLPAMALADGLVAVGRGGLHVTEGRLEGGDRLRVEVSKFRAVAPTAEGSAAELRFTYLGRTQGVAPLRSGEMREQLGLKLRAADGCNVLYAMWRLAPSSGLVVSVKRNPGQHRSDECTNHGYRNLKPLRSAPVPQPKPGSAHVMAAALRGDRLEVRVDGAVVWDGRVPPEALELRGPPGLRSDNARFDFELAVAPGDGPEVGTH